MGRSSREPRKRGRLSRSGDFDRAYREGESHSNRHLILYAFPRPDGDDDDGIRLGISVGRKLGSAVYRNRIKRLLREAFWSIADRVPDNHDFVIVARDDVAELAEREGEVGLRSCLEDVIREGRLSRMKRKT
jgi:ribonuclease P protein component